jgi:hypothetical protein
MPVFKEELVQAFIQYKERGTATGLRLHGRSSLLITTIEEVVDLPYMAYITVNKHSIYGERIVQTQIAVHQIEKVLWLRILFNDPFYMKLRALRQNVSELRHSSGDRTISLV